MNKVFFSADTRGHADHGWLNANYSFSFGNYFNRDRMNFGALRVLNDDTISPGKGFGYHPHENMEIITIPLKGDLEHKDSMGNLGIINEGEIQVMSAGSGIFHSEFNKNSDKSINLLQLWVLPKRENVEPRYDQCSIQGLRKLNSFYMVLSPHPEDNVMWIHQDAWFHLGDFDKVTSIDYELKREGNGVYIFVIEGNFNVSNQKLNKRDALGVWNTDIISFKAQPNSRVLLVEVPMKF
tara:strand:- start:5273 stop:5986 length:714 start_codon:yes stop_codon:yes gene_type:complete